MKYFEVIAFLVIFIECGKSHKAPHKRVVIHLPLKVKHHHHTHTVYKPIHHVVPVKVDQKEHWEDDDGYGEEYHYGNGRMLESLLTDWVPPEYSYPHDSSTEREDKYENFEKFLKKISKTKQKLFNNKQIGWNGRKNFDKIASEYLAHIKNNPQNFEDFIGSQHGAHNEDDDDNGRKKRRGITE